MPCALTAAMADATAKSEERMVLTGGYVWRMVESAVEEDCRDNWVVECCG